MRVLKPYLIHHSWWNISRGARKIVACEPSSSSNNSWDGLERWRNSSSTCISKYSHFLGWFRLRFIESNSKNLAPVLLFHFNFSNLPGAPCWECGQWESSLLGRPSPSPLSCSLIDVHSNLFFYCRREVSTSRYPIASIFPFFSVHSSILWLVKVTSDQHSSCSFHLYFSSMLSCCCYRNGNCHLIGIVPSTNQQTKLNDVPYHLCENTPPSLGNNHSGEFYLGYSRQELLDVSWYQLLHWDFMREAQSKHRLSTRF